MSFQVGTVCYPDSTSALEAIAAQISVLTVPGSGTNTMPYYIFASAVSSTTITLKAYYSSNGLVAYTTTLTPVLMPCVVPDVSSTFDYTQGAAIFSFFLTNVLICWWVAKNAGVIIDLIRRAGVTVRR